MGYGSCLIKKGMLFNRRIVIIDNDKESLELQARLLSDQGAKLLTAETFEEGFKLLDAHEDTELIVLDTELPDIDGPDAVEKLRDDDRFILTPLLVVSNDYGKGSQLSLLELGITKFLSKPYFHDALLLATMEILP